MTNLEEKNDVNMIGIVVIGRNEGERLNVCLNSVLKYGFNVVYVDSGSEDDSVRLAKHLGVSVVYLDLSIPFTAARARNEGVYYLMNKYSNIQYIQFIDGDCEIDGQWIDRAELFLEKNIKYAAVCGRVRERFPENSIYNRLMDIEWDTPVGDVLACGGIVMIRAEAFNQVNGFRDDLIAGEEPEMCFRMRSQGWKISGLDAEMAKHDAAMSKFSQWWKRKVRTGYAFALGSSIHGKSKERYWVRENHRIVIWGLAIPALISGLIIFNPLFLLLLFIYVVQIIRVAKNRDGLGKVEFIWAASVVLGKFPEAIGLIQHKINKVAQRSTKIIEYK